MTVRKTTAFVLMLVVTAIPSRATAEPVLVHGRIVGESGQAIDRVTLQVRGESLDVSQGGEFALSLDTPTTVLLEISAPGYYSFAHTLHRSDFVPGRVATMPAIELVQKKPERTLLVFAGDSMLSRRYFEPRDGEPILVRRERIVEDGRKLLRHVRPYVELADYASVNLETQLSAAELKNPVPKSVTFYSPVELASLLEWTGFDYVALGNNHMFDYRDEGLKATFDALGNTILDYSGAGHDERQAREPARVDIDGRPHSFLSYVGWRGTFEPSQVAEQSKGGATLASERDIAAALGELAEDSVAVLQLHSGLEYAASPALTERSMLRQAVVEGADIAIGHHAHVLQGFEIYDDRLIAYSLGNFLFDQYHYTTQLGMLLYVWMDGEMLHRAEAMPLHINGYVPTPATGSFRHAVLTRLARLSDASVCMRASGFHALIESCDGTPKTGTRIVIPESASGVPVHVRTLGASPFTPLFVDAGERLHRLGIDLLRRGDFEYARLYGAHDRTWVEGKNASLKTGNNNHLEVRIPPGGETVRTGMKVFERVFTLSNPATVSGRMKIDGNVRIRFLLQRRRPTDTLDDALANGPITEIGVTEQSSANWHEFSFDHNQPRIATRSVRLLIEIEDISVEQSGAAVSFDDIAWVEWQTPWRDEDDRGQGTNYATHLQLKVKP